MRILMTGCSSGTGNYVASSLEQQGHEVYKVGLGGPNLKIDFTKVENPYLTAEYIFYTAEKHFLGKKVEVLINNAGLTKSDYIEDMDQLDYNKVMMINLTMPYFLTRELSKRVVKEDTPDLRKAIFVSTMGVKMGLRAQSPYVISKAAVEALTRSLAKEFAGRLPIATYCIAPSGIADTQMEKDMLNALIDTRGMSQEEAKTYLVQSPTGRWSTHKEVWDFFDLAVNKLTIQSSGTILSMTAGMGL